VEPAYPGQVGPEVNPVSEELLNRAIRANVELAQALGQLVRDLGDVVTNVPWLILFVLGIATLGYVSIRNGCFMRPARVAASGPQPQK